jgi:hypothetical protein
MILTRKPDDSDALTKQFDAAPQPGSPSGELETLRGFIEAGDAEGAYNYCHGLGLKIAAESLNHISGKLGDTPAGVALRRVITGSEQSYRDDAKLAGCSAKNLHKTEGKIRKRLGV